MLNHRVLAVADLMTVLALGNAFSPLRRQPTRERGGSHELRPLQSKDRWLRSEKWSIFAAAQEDQLLAAASPTVITGRGREANKVTTDLT